MLHKEIKWNAPLGLNVADIPEELKNIKTIEKYLSMSKNKYQQRSKMNKAY